MATARERAVQRVYEQIPHPGVQFAYLALEAGNVDEFESLKAEALKSPALAHYRSALSGQAAVTAEETVTEKKATVKAAAAAAKARTKKSSETATKPDTEEGASDAGEGSDSPKDASDASDAPSAPAQSETAEESPKDKARRIARERLMSRQKGA